MKNTLAATLVAASALIVTAVQAATPEVEALLQAAQKEGAVYSVGMPNTWANWVKTWSDLQTKYKIKTQDTDMASAEQISKFMAEGENATSDIGDVGFEFGEIAKKRGITMPYKPSTWDQIPLVPCLHRHGGLYYQQGACERHSAHVERSSEGYLPCFCGCCGLGCSS